MNAPALFADDRAEAPEWTEPPARPAPRTVRRHILRRWHKGEWHYISRRARMLDDIPARIETGQGRWITIYNARHKLNHWTTDADQAERFTSRNKALEYRGMLEFICRARAARYRGLIEREGRTDDPDARRILEYLERLEASYAAPAPVEIEEPAR